MAPPRVVVFLDEKNVYRGARRAFFDDTDHHACGQFHPLSLGKLLASRLPHGIKEPRDLLEVRLYTSAPNPTFDPKTHGAHLKQSEGWGASGVNVISRPLRYRGRRPPGEQKGVDVALAVDFVTMAVEDSFDVGIIFSSDTDLRPALEFVAARGHPVAEVASWWSESSQGYLSISSTQLWSHRLKHEDYKLVADYTDYNV